eukprot:NODE_183_length_13752_cov_1.079103.p2 type:complete len:381 gc:universal NODE_183_length_13752_cov_1.079103:8141-6999(-)
MSHHLKGASLVVFSPSKKMIENFSEDILNMLLLNLEESDIYHLSLVNKSLYSKLYLINWKHLFVNPSNYLHLIHLLEINQFHGDQVVTLSIFGEFERSQIPELSVLWQHLTPTHFRINSSVVDFPSFYKTASFLKHVKVLKAYCNCIDWCEFDLMPNLQECWTISSQDSIAYLKCQDKPNVKTAILWDNVGEINDDYADFVYGGTRALPQLVQKMTFAFITELWIMNVIYGHENITMDFSSVLPWTYPNLKTLKIFEKKQYINTFKFLADFKNLELFDYETDHLINFNTLPKECSLKQLNLRAKHVFIDLHFQNLLIPQFNIYCQEIHSDLPIVEMPRVHELKIKLANMTLWKMKNQFMKKFGSRWQSIEKNDFISMINQ